MGQAEESNFPTTQVNFVHITESIDEFNLKKQALSPKIEHKSLSNVDDPQDLEEDNTSSDNTEDNTDEAWEDLNEVNVTGASYHSENHEYCAPTQVAETSKNEKKHHCTFPGCGAKFLKPSRLLRHTRNHTGERPYRCTHSGCERTYTNSSHLARHLKVSHTVRADEKFPCHKCDVVTSSAYSLKRHHQRAHERVNKFTCATCNVAFNKRSRLSIHEATHKADELRHCAKCNKSFPFAYRFRNHMKTHEKKSYSCKNSQCSEVFEKWTDLQKHCRDNHPTDYKCPECEESFPSKLKLRSHSKVHSKDPKRLECPHEGCSRYYQHKRNLNSHIRGTHLGIKYHCDFCNRGLISKQCLIRHIECQHMANKEQKKVVKKSSARCKRKDANTIKSSIITKMIGVNLPPSYNKIVLNRDVETESSKNFVTNKDDE